MCAQTIQLNRQIYTSVCWSQLILAQGNCGKHLFSNLCSIMSSFLLEIGLGESIYNKDIVNAETISFWFLLSSESQFLNIISTPLDLWHVLYRITHTWGTVLKEKQYFYIFYLYFYWDLIDIQHYTCFRKFDICIYCKMITT